MTFWAKVFTVLVFVLALVFASMSGILYTKRTDFAQTLKNQTDEYMATLKAKTEAAAESEAKRLKAEEDFRVKDSQLVSVTAQLKVESENARKQADEVVRLGKELQGVKAERTTLTETLKNISERHRQVEKELADRVKELNTKRDELSAARDQIQKLTSSLSATEEERDKLATSLKAAEETLRQHERKFAELRRIHYNDAVLLAILDRTEPVLKDISGRVLSVDAKNGLVVINKGTKDGVLKDYLFTVHRDGKYLAQIRVDTLASTGDMAAAKVVNMNRENLPIQQGDSVDTRLIP